MSVIKVRCTDQVLKITEAPVVASGGKNEVKVEFSFCEKWDGFTKTAVFYRDIEEPYYALLNSEDVCVVPWEVYTEAGTFYFSVFGDKEETRRTSTTVRYKVKESGLPEGAVASDPTPDVYSQILEKMGKIPETLTVTCVTEEEASHSANEIREYAKNGWNVRLVVGNRELMLDRFDNGIATFVYTDAVTTEDGVAFQHDKYYIFNNKLIGKFSEVFPQNVGIEVDSDLVSEGKAADAKATGEAIKAVSETMNAALENAVNESMEEINNQIQHVESVTQSNFHLLENALQELADHVENLHYKPIEITSCTISPSVAEKGSGVDSVTVSWAVNKNPASQSVEGESVDAALRSKQISGLALISDKSFAVRVQDERDLVDSDSAWLRFYNGVYYGALAADGVINSSAILSLTRSLQAGKGKTFTATAGEGQKFAYALPSRYGTPAFNVGGWDYVWEKAATFDFTNASGYTEEYDVWLNDVVVVGTRTIKVT